MTRRVFHQTSLARLAAHQAKEKSQSRRTRRLMRPGQSPKTSKARGRNQTNPNPASKGKASVTQTGRSATTIGGLPNVGGMALSRLANVATRRGKKPAIASGNPIAKL